MRYLVLLLLVILAISPKAISYPQDQLKDCITSAQKNPNVKDISQSSIEQYCDCALTLIVDEKKDVRESGYKCASENFD